MAQLLNNRRARQLLNYFRLRNLNKVSGMTERESLQLKKDYEALFKKNYARMFYCALDLVEDAETARDIVGDVACETWRRMAALKAAAPDVNLAAYMINAVRNRALNQLKHRAVENSYINDALKLREQIAEEPSDVHEERLRLVWQVMENLTLQTRAVFEQCWFENKSYKETAELLGISTSAVHKHVSKAFAAFRKEFGVKISAKEVTILLLTLLTV